MPCKEIDTQCLRSTRRSFSRRSKFVLIVGTWQYSNCDRHSRYTQSIFIKRHLVRPRDTHIERLSILTVKSTHFNCFLLLIVPVKFATNCKLVISVQFPTNFKLRIHTEPLQYKTTSSSSFQGLFLSRLINGMDGCFPTV